MPDLPQTPRPLAWSGISLMPHHLQWSDAYGGDRLAYLMGLLAPHAWGVSELDIDVTKDDVRVARVVARFPPGLVVDRRRPNEALLRPLSPEVNGRAHVDVFLGVAQPSPNAPNVTDDPSTLARFASTGDAILPSAHLLFGDEGRHAERMPLGRIVRTGTSISVAPWHLPPMTRVPVGSPLLSKLNALVEVLKERRVKILDSRRGTDGYLDAERLPQLRLLVAINRALASLTKLRTRGAPEPTFNVLARLLGTIEPLAQRHEDLPAYVHEDPGPAFREVLERLTATIRAAAPDPYEEILFERFEDFAFRASVPDPRLLRKRIYLVASGVDRKAAKVHIPQFAKIGGGSRFSYIVQRSLPGVECAVALEPPPSLPDGPSDICFCLQQRGEDWDDVVRTGVLAVFVPQAPASMTLTLYVVEG